MKLLLLILGIVSFSPLVQQRSTPANEKDLKRQRQQARAIALEERAEKTVDPAARNLAWVEVALAVDVEDYARAKSFAENISDDTH